MRAGADVACRAKGRQPARYAVLVWPASYGRMLRRPTVGAAVACRFACTDASPARRPARDAQTILGHTRISTTLEIYTDTDEQARRDALTRLHGLLDQDNG
jgi:hypothetical protein